MALLKDQRFYELCQALQCTGQTPSDPDRKAIEKAFRKLALKTHPDKGGDPTKFRVVNDAYNKLIAHINRLERMEAESELRNTSVIIEISKQAMPKWWEKLKNQYGQPKSSDVKNTLFQGPYKQYKGRGKLTGPITLILYEDPEDKIPKIHCKCQNYMAWIQEQKMPLHLHVNKDKKVSFDQWRIMSLAEYDFINIEPSSSARHDWKSQGTPRGEPQQSRQQEQEETERRAREAEEQKAQAKKAEEDKRRAEEEEEAERKRQSDKEDEKNKPWWHRYSDRYQGFNMGETTPPPDSPPPTRSTKDDGFPKVFNMTSNAFTVGGLSSNNKNAQTTETMNAKEEEKEILQTENVDQKESLPNQHSSNPQPEQQTQEESILKGFESDTTPVEDQRSESKSQTERPKTPPEIEQENETIKSKETYKNVTNLQMTREKVEIVEQEVKAASIPEVVVLEKLDEPILAESEDIILATRATESDLKKRDLGKLAEKLVNKSKIKKIKSRKISSKKLSTDDVNEADKSGECLENPDSVDNPGEADDRKSPNGDEKDKGPASIHQLQNHDQSGHHHQEEKLPDPGVHGGAEDSFTTIDHIDHSEKYLTLASGQVELENVTPATGGCSDIGQHLLTAGHGSTSVKADTEEIKVETQNQILISSSDNASKGNETVNVSLADIQASDDKNLECDKEDEPLIANDSELSNTSTPFYSPQVSVEDDEGVLKHGFSDSIQRDLSTPTKLMTNKSLSPFSTDHDEPTRRLSHENCTPSRWRRGGVQNSMENDQSYSSGDARVPSDGVVRSRSVHTLHAFQRESSPQRKTSFEDNKLSSSNIKQNYSRNSNSYATSTPISHLPPAKPPPPSTGSQGTASNHRARMLENSTLKKDLSTPPKPSLKATSTFTADHFLRSKPDNAAEKSKQNDKIPSRFRRARDHATAASMTDLSKKPNDYSVFREQILLAKHEHQKLCDQALNYDPKRVRNGMNTGASGRATTPGPTFFGPPPAMPAPPQDYQLRSSRFELKSDLSKSKSMKNLSAGYQIPSGSRTFFTRR